jgi:hypothetical protein
MNIAKTIFKILKPSKHYTKDGYLCQGCGRRFKVEVNISMELWLKIRPLKKDGGSGLLCGECIMRRIEAFGEFASYKLVRSG